MKIAAPVILLVIIILTTSCRKEPEAIDCHDQTNPSSLNATDREILNLLNRDYTEHYVISETLESAFQLDPNWYQGWNIDSTTLISANTRIADGGFIGDKDFPGKPVISQSYYNCVGTTYELSPGQGLYYIQFSLPGYSIDSTEAIVRMDHGSWQFWSGSCEILLRKDRDGWYSAESICIVQ